MAQKKAFEVDAAIKTPDPKYRVILLYGPDTGLVSERADVLSKNTGVDLADPFSLIRLNADQVAEDKSRLSDEAFTVGMFGGERLIRVSGTTRKNLVDAVKPVLGVELQDTWIVIEAGDLAKSAGLRTAFEKSRFGLALPCYQDDAKALDNLVREEIRDKGLAIDQEAIAFLLPLLGGDRLASRNELQKLALYCHGKTEVTLEDIKEIVGDASQIETSDTIDAVAAGDLKSFNNMLQRTLTSGVAPDMLLLFTLRHFQLLHEMKAAMEQKRLPAMTVISSARPPIHFSRKNKVSSALEKWSLPAIERAMQRLDTASFEARANSELGNSIAGTNLLALAIEATRGARS